MRNLEEWADDHGYRRGRCPRCRRTVWSDAAFECSCSYYDDEEEDVRLLPCGCAEEEEDDDDEG